MFDYQPVFIAVSPSANAGRYSTVFVFNSNYAISYYGYSSNGWGKHLRLSWSNNSLSWYANPFGENPNAEMQLNERNNYYFFGVMKI